METINETRFIQNEHTGWRQGQFIDKYPAMPEKEKAQHRKDEELLVRPSLLGNAICRCSTPEDAKWIANRLNLAATLENQSVEDKEIIKALRDQIAGLHRMLETPPPTMPESCEKCTVVNCHKNTKYGSKGCIFSVRRFLSWPKNKPNTIKGGDGKDDLCFHFGYIDPGNETIPMSEEDQKAFENRQCYIEVPPELLPSDQMEECVAIENLINKRAMLLPGESYPPGMGPQHVVPLLGNESIRRTTLEDNRA